MAACHSPKPVVVLTDVINLVSEEEDIQEIGSRHNLNGISTRICPVLKFPSTEQIEPLNLSVMNLDSNCGRAKTGASSEGSDLENSENSDDSDVIFVKEYPTVKKMKLALQQQEGSTPTVQRGRRRKIKKLGTKEEPRRNPVRQARNAKRFEEYTDLNLSENDFVGDFEDEDQIEAAFTPDCEDVEEWNIQKVARKTRPRRKVFAKRRAWGRRRKLGNKTDEKKVPVDDLEPLFCENLLLLKTFYKNVNERKRIVDDSEKNKQDKSKKSSEKNCDNKQKVLLRQTVDIIKRQVMFLSVTTDASCEDILNRFKSERPSS